MSSDYRLPIAGEMMESGQVDEVTDPYNGHVVGRVPLATEEQREAAIVGAVEAFSELKAMPRFRRAEICSAIAAGIAGLL